MGLLSDVEVGALRIERMIFHVVGPEDDDLVLMDEVDIRGAEDFFLERIRETNIGNRFSFIGREQGVRPSLQSMANDPQGFVALSKQLAESFHNQHQTVASKKGAFIVAILSGINRPAFALIKFDDLRVLRFRSEITPDGSVRAIVTEVENTFQEDKKAMQKSALVLLSEEGGDLAVYDRTNRANITDYFKAFLGVRRLYTPEQATVRFKKALEAAFASHRAQAPDGIRVSWRERLFNATRARETIEPEDDLEVFGATVFGEFWTHDGFRASVSKALENQKISGEAIVIHRNAFTKPTIRRVRTREDVVLRYPEDLDGVIVNIRRNDGGGATITINTQEILDNDLLDAQAAD